MELINDSVIFLSGFLKGLAEINGDIREKKKRPKTKQTQSPINDPRSCFGRHRKSMENGPQNKINIEINQNQYR